MNIFVKSKIVEAIVCYPLLVSEKVKGLSAEVNDLFIRGCGEVESISPVASAPNLGEDSSLRLSYVPLLLIFTSKKLLFFQDKMFLMKSA